MEGHVWCAYCIFPSWATVVIIYKVVPQFVLLFTRETFGHMAERHQFVAYLIEDRRLEEPNKL